MLTTSKGRKVSCEARKDHFSVADAIRHCWLWAYTRACGGHVHSGVGLDVGMRVGMFTQAWGWTWARAWACSLSRGMGLDVGMRFGFHLVNGPELLKVRWMNVDQIGCGTHTLGASQNILTDCVAEMDLSGVIALRFCTASICMRMNSNT